MKRKILVTLLILLLAICSLGLFACGGSGNDGKYYLYENWEFDNDSWVLIEDGLWETDDGESGKVKISGKEITLYFEYLGYEEELFSGTIKDGCLTLNIMGVNVSYYKENATIKTNVNFNANGGTFSNGTNTYTQKDVIINSLIKEPTAPTRDNYSFVGWAKSDNDTETWQFDKDTVTRETTLYAVWTVLKFTPTSDGYTATGVHDNNLTEIIFPDFITDISANAFENCNNLKTVIFSKDSQLKSIDNDAFINCPIENATIPTKAISFIPKTNLKTVTITNGEQIADNAFKNCDNLKSVTFGDSVTEIGRYAFYYCRGLENINIPDSIIEIGDYAFDGCSALTSVIISNNITSLGNGTFNSCPIETASIPTYAIDFIPKDNLKTLTITSGREIKGSAFSDCDSLESVIIGDSVTEIGGYAFYDCDGLTTAIIGDNVTNLGDKTFYSCSSLTSITIPESVISIASEAFDGCENLVKINYKGTIDSWVMIDFSTSKANPSYYSDYLFINNTDYKQITEINLSTASKTGSYVFYGYDNLTNVTIPDSVISIGDSAFYDCSALTSVTIGEKVTNIGSSAFDGCSSLTSITIPDSVTSIGDYAFYGCSSLTSITIPDSVTNIARNTFSGCSALTSITIGCGVKTISNSAFNTCSALSEINFNAINCSIIRDYSLSGEPCVFNNAGINGNGITLKIGSNVTQIPSKLFAPTDHNSSAANITKIVFEENSVCDSISKRAFYNCNTLISATIPNSVTSIGSNAFSGCSKLTSITIPDSVTFIGSGAFSRCDNLQFNLYDNAKYLGNSSNKYLVLINVTDTTITNFTIEANTKHIYSRAFENCFSLKNVTIGDNVTSIGDDVFYGCTVLTSIMVNEENINFSSQDGVLYNKNKTTLIYCPNGKSNEFIIPDSVTSIGDYAFYDCDNLTSVVIPDSVTSIGDFTFFGCDSLENITIGEKVTSIGNAFAYCHKLVEVINKSELEITTTSYGLNALQVLTEESVTSNFIEKDNYIFYNHNGTYYLLGYKGTNTELVLPTDINGNNYSIYNYAFLNCKSLISITIPDSVTSIGDSAFYDCSTLISATIGKQVTNIGSSAFRGCSALTSITIPDSVTSIGNSAFYNCSALTSITIGDGVTTIGDYAFEDCSALTSITIPESVTRIGNVAFYGCSNLTNVIFEDTSDWYRTYNSDYTGGSKVTVTNETDNANYLRVSYIVNFYWYKV